MRASDPKNREQEDDCGLIGPINSESLVLAGTIGLPRAFPLTLMHQRRADANDCGLQREREGEIAAKRVVFVPTTDLHRKSNIFDYVLISRPTSQLNEAEKRT